MSAVFALVKDMVFGTIRSTWAQLHPAWKVISAILAAWDGVAWIFIGLKLAGVITWSWWWVFSPIWGFVVAPILLAALLAPLMLLLAKLGEGLDEHGGTHASL